MVNEGSPHLQGQEFPLNGEERREHSNRTGKKRAAINTFSELELCCQEINGEKINKKMFETVHGLL